MKKIIGALAMAGAFAVAGPASAQIVNGLNGSNPPVEAPIGTKAGASDASQQAPGEAEATAGARLNSRDAKAMRLTTDRTLVRHRHHHRTDGY